VSPPLRKPWSTSCGGGSPTLLPFFTGTIRRLQKFCSSQNRSFSLHPSPKTGLDFFGRLPFFLWAFLDSGNLDIAYCWVVQSSVCFFFPSPPTCVPLNFRLGIWTRFLMGVGTANITLFLTKLYWPPLRRANPSTFLGWGCEYCDRPFHPKLVQPAFYFFLGRFLG